VVGFAVSVPFFDLSGVFEGPVAKALGDVDISWAPGLLVAGVVYWGLMRGVDLGKEEVAIAGSERELEVRHLAG
jgi:cytosine/uracil/thiamine/allantoin permease